MKILHVNDRYNRNGGVQQYILEAGALLSQQGHQNSILYTEQDATTIQNGDWPAYHIPLDHADVKTAVDQALQLEKPDVAYIHHVASPEIIMALTRSLPTVAYVHGFTAVCPGLAKYYRRGDEVCARAFGLGCIPMHYLRRCSAARRPTVIYRLMTTTYKLMQALKTVPKLLVGSHYMRQLLGQNGFLPERISVLPPHFIKEADIPALNSSSGIEDEGLILYAGRLELEKGFPYLLQAMTELPASVRLKVAGDGSLHEQYKTLAKQLDLSSRVEFLGWQSSKNMGQLYQKSALLVLPSIIETFGKVGLEAMCNNKPVVAFNVGGIPDWLQDGVNGYLVEPTNSCQLAQKINQLLQDSALRRKMGETGRQLALEQYRAGSHLDQLVQVLGMAVGKPIQSQ